MSNSRSMEEQKMEHFRETMDRLTAASHVQTEYFADHQKIEGYYENLTEGRFFKCDRLMKQENMFGKIQLGYNPNRKRVFIFANLKTSRYDTVASRYQKEMKDYQRKSLLKGDNENRAYVSKRRENATVLIEKKENKPWTQRSIRSYLGRANMEAVQKTMPFFTREEELKELQELRAEQKELQESIRDMRVQLSVKEENDERERLHSEDLIRRQRKLAVGNQAKENLLEAIVIRKETAEKHFLRKINYAYDFQKKDIESYYREKRRALEDAAHSANREDDGPEDEES